MSHLAAQRRLRDVQTCGRAREWCQGEGFPVDATAGRYDASVAEPIGDPKVAYADVPEDEPARVLWPPLARTPW